MWSSLIELWMGFLIFFYKEDPLLCPSNGTMPLVCNSGGLCLCCFPEGIQAGEPSTALKACDCFFMKYPQKKRQLGGYKPLCDESGYFEKKQCWSSTGKCWCADQNGKKLTEATRGDLKC